MKFGLQRKHGSLNSVPVFDAVAKGLSKLGHTVVNDTTECDIPVLWSMLWHGRMKDNKKIYESALSQKKKVLFLDGVCPYVYDKLQNLEYMQEKENEL